MIRMLIVLAALTAAAAGCQSKTKSSFKMQPYLMELTSEPSGATITQIMPFGGSRMVIGQTPLKSQIHTLSQMSYTGSSLSEGQQLMSQIGTARLEFSKAGYEPVVGNYSITTADGGTTHHIELNPVDPAPSDDPPLEETPGMVGD